MTRAAWMSSVLLGGCSLVVDPASTAGPCESNAKCDPGSVCSAGACVVLTAGDSSGGGDAAAGDPVTGDSAAGDPLPGDPLPGDPGNRIELSWTGPDILCETGLTSDETAGTLMVTLIPAPAVDTLVIVTSTLAGRTVFTNITVPASSGSGTLPVEGSDDDEFTGLEAGFIVGDAGGYAGGQVEISVDDCEAIVLYPGPTSTGIIDAADVRTVANDLCASVKPGRCGARNAWAMLSIDGFDQISDRFATVPLQSNYHVYGINGHKLADNWAALVGADLPVDLATATGLDSPWWSGSNQNGLVSSDTCSGWSTEVASGRLGVQDQVVAAEWLAGLTRQCSVGAQLLCVCYDE